MDVKPIKIKKTALEIPINEENDTIKINLDDQIFIKNFLAISEYGKENKPTDGENLGKVFEYCSGISKRIDDTFGENTTVKIFGTQEPTFDTVVDFLLQLEPYIEMASKRKLERLQDIEKEYTNRSNVRETMR